MKICYIADATSIHIVEWLKFFVAKGHEVFLITDTDNQIKGVTIFNTGDCLPKIHFPFLSACYQIIQKMYKIKKIIKKIKPDLIHAHYATNYGFLAALTGFHPFILTCHGADIIYNLWQNNLKRFFVRYAIFHSDFITTPSGQMKDLIVKEGINPDKIFTIQYGVDTKAFPFSNILKSPLRIISTRVLEKDYRIDLLIEAIPKIIEHYDDIEFIIIGDGREKSNLLLLAQSLGIIHKVKFLGKIGHCEIPYFYQNSQIYITTSPTDGISISLLEALSSGCFPVLPDNPPNRSIYNLGFKIKFFKVDNVNSLADSIIDTVESIHMKKTDTEQNRNLVISNFSREYNLGAVNNIYKKYNLVK